MSCPSDHNLRCTSCWHAPSVLPEWPHSVAAEREQVHVPLPRLPVQQAREGYSRASTPGESLPAESLLRPRLDSAAVSRGLCGRHFGCAIAVGNLVCAGWLGRRLAGISGPMCDVSALLVLALLSLLVEGLCAACHAASDTCCCLLTAHLAYKGLLVTASCAPKPYSISPSGCCSFLKPMVSLQLSAAKCCRCPMLC